MNWIKVNNELPEPNTRCKAKTPDGVDLVGEAWFDGKEWWWWPLGSFAKFGMRSGWIQEYIPLEIRN